MGRLDIAARAAFLVLALNALSAAEPLRPVPPERFPHFVDNGQIQELRSALDSHIARLLTARSGLTLNIGSRRITRDEMLSAFVRFRDYLTRTDGADVNWFIRSHFDVYQPGRESDTPYVRLTGYCTPVVAASLEPDSQYRYPLYGHPGRPARRLSRRDIDVLGRLRGCEIAWLRDPLDRYSVHVEGAGILLLPDGRKIGVHYAGGNGRPYTSLRSIMIESGILPRGNSDMRAIREWLSRHPSRRDELLSRNESYIFFRLGPEPASGAVGLPLVPERSLAVDRSRVPLGLLCWVATQTPVFEPTGSRARTDPWYRFMVADDVGGAIRGAARADIYFGEDYQARQLADCFDDRGMLYYLIPKRSPGDRVRTRT